MNKTIMLSLLCAFLLLPGCSSAPITLNYYKLDTADGSEIKERHNNAPVIAIHSVRLAEHLRGRNLVMQQTDLTLSIATKHLWAEPLEDDIGTLLAREIRSSGKFDAFYSPAPQLGFHGAQQQISLVIEHFIPLASGDVVLSGYWFDQHNKQLPPQRFHYRQELSQDGYPHAVAKMRQLLARLGSDITQTLATSSAEKL
ncbi:PqiC family protein [Alteromonas flava]|uniref:PqiC family protein n=1 Tax=Alteromonas flava TaxID=2048003 RepID=UPI000C2937BF|nr:ABC-type transport auxiliary lipoprotein family protein [Alteromonas flava]